MKTSRMLFSQKEDLQLNEDTKIILMKPGQDLYLRFAPKLEKVMKILFGKKEGDSILPWTENEEEYNYVNSVIKPILIYSIRNPNDYKKRLLVDSNQIPGPDQEYYDDFNPVLDAKILESQGFYKNADENTRIFTPQLTLFFIVLRKSGWMSADEDTDVKDVETFPKKPNGNEETVNSEAV